MLSRTRGNTPKPGPPTLGQPTQSTRDIHFTGFHVFSRGFTHNSRPPAARPPQPGFPKPRLVSNRSPVLRNRLSRNRDPETGASETGLPETATPLKSDTRHPKRDFPKPAPRTPGARNHDIQFTGFHAFSRWFHVQFTVVSVPKNSKHLKKRKTKIKQYSAAKRRETYRAAMKLGTQL